MKLLKKGFACPDCGKTYRCPTCGRPYKSAGQVAKILSKDESKRTCKKCKTNFSVAVGYALKKLVSRKY